MSEKIPQENKSYEEKVLSEEAQETFKKVQEGREKKESQDARVSQLKTHISQIISEIEAAFEGGLDMTQDPEVGMDFLKGTWGKIAEGSKLINELKRVGGLELDVKRLENKFGAFRERMAAAEDQLESKVLGNAS